MTLIELDKILLVPPEKWESLIHRPRRFEHGIDISRTVFQEKKKREKMEVRAIMTHMEYKI